MEWIVGVLAFAVLWLVAYALVNEEIPPTYRIDEASEGVFWVLLRNPEFGNYRALQCFASKEAAEAFIAEVEA